MVSSDTSGRSEIWFHSALYNCAGEGGYQCASQVTTVQATTYSRAPCPGTEEE